MDVKPLQEIGLTQGEIKVYLALIKLGETTSGPLVHESQVSVSKVYNILDRLAKKGLVSHIVKSNMKHFKAADPSRLNDYMREKEQQIKSQKESLQSLIPYLQLLHGSATTHETVQVFDGLKGIQTARERTLNIMKKGDLMWVLGIAKTPYDGFLLPYFKDYHNRRIKKGIRCKFLYNDYAKNPFGNIASKYKLSQVRYMKKNFITHAWIEIYADTVTIGINKSASFSIVIQNNEVADSFRIYAKIVWESAMA